MASIYDYYNTGNDSFHSLKGSDNLAAQIFTASDDYKILSVKLLLQRRTGDPGTVTVELQGVGDFGSGEVPDGNVFATGSIAGGGITLADGGEWVEITFDSEYSLTSGSKYSIVLSISVDQFYLRWLNDSSSPSYAGGAAAVYALGSWSTAATRDELFETWGNPAGTPPTITDQTSSPQDADYEDDITFSVTVTGTEPITYQWYKDGSPISGETNSTLSLSSVDADDGGTYYCIATNAGGSAQSSDIDLRIIPYITAQSSSTSFSLGALSSISVTADGFPSVTYQWYKNGSPISGATSSTYSFYAASSDAGTYKCIATNAAGSATSSDIVLTIVSNPYVYSFFNLPHDITREQ